MYRKTGLVIGATRQDGSYMAKLLLDKGYKVYGTRRYTLSANIRNLKALGIDKKVHLIKSSISDFRS